jgi:hypothetical protein
MLSWDGIDVAVILKDLKIVKKLESHTLKIQLNAIMKLKLSNNVTVNRRKIFPLIFSMKVEPLCLPVFNDAKECLFQGKNIFYEFYRRQSYLEL